jgi:hypothetical protein
MMWCLTTHRENLLLILLAGAMVEETEEQREHESYCPIGQHIRME